ncbi:MAG TPA: cation transporter [Desulfobulbus sp.]|nr:cation transporter [Desulfobulbus sp.]
MAHQHSHDHAIRDDRWLGLAIGINVLLTVAQVAGGIFSGSLSLIADALHNFSDAGALLIAWVARRIGRRPADARRTFGYRRAEIIAALINLVTLVLVGLYLLAEAVQRFFAPQVIEGWTVVLVAAVALVVDVFTALLTWKMSASSINIRAAFLHNVSDALASAGVILAGSLILLFRWYWTDTLVTLLIAGYVLHQAAGLLPQTIRILMQSTPDDIPVSGVIAAMEEVEGVVGVHHVHIWQLDEQNNALEAHVAVRDFHRAEQIKTALKKRLAQRFNITHSTLELESEPCDSRDHDDRT